MTNGIVPRDGDQSTVPWPKSVDDQTWGLWEDESGPYTRLVPAHTMTWLHQELSEDAESLLRSAGKNGYTSEHESVATPWGVIKVDLQYTRSGLAPLKWHPVIPKPGRTVAEVHHNYEHRDGFAGPAMIVPAVAFVAMVFSGVLRGLDPVTLGLSVIALSCLASAVAWGRHTSDRRAGEISQDITEDRFEGSCGEVAVSLLCLTEESVQAEALKVIAALPDRRDDEIEEVVELAETINALQSAARDTPSEADITDLCRSALGEYPDSGDTYIKYVLPKLQSLLPDLEASHQDSEDRKELDPGPTPKDLTPDQEKKIRDEATIDHMIDPVIDHIRQNFAHPNTQKKQKDDPDTDRPQ